MQKQIPDWLENQLPEYEKVEYVKPAFSDSTHQLWRLQGSSLDNKNHFLKLCSNTESPFWSIMQDLFDFNLSAEIANFSKTYRVIDKTCTLKIPALISNEVTNQGSYILTSELLGEALGSRVNDEMVRQLANHLAELHSFTNRQWGVLHNPQFKTADWFKRLIAVLEKSSKKWGGVLRLRSATDYDSAQGKFTRSATDYGSAQGKLTRSATDYDSAQGKLTRSATDYDSAQGKLIRSATDYGSAQGKLTRSATDYDFAQGKFTRSATDYGSAQGKLIRSATDSTEFSLSVPKGSVIDSAALKKTVYLQENAYLTQALAVLSSLPETSFIPMMPDLRWDQFLQKDNKLNALVDLDAFVYAPRELDFVILEYLLTPAQMAIFVDNYTQTHTIPDITQVRPAYRLLLFYMQILGEVDLDAWMKHESVL